MAMNASDFRFNGGTHLVYIKLAYTFLIEAYQQQIKNNYFVKENNENTMRNDLVEIAETKKDMDFPFRWIPEFPDIGNRNRIDIDLATPQSLVDKSNAIKIECKIVGEDKYIDSKKSFERKSSPTNGIMSFISGKYAAQMPLAGMIGFIKEGKIETKIKAIERRLQNHVDITTCQNLIVYPIKENFEFSYHSIHERKNNLSKISIYHLFFDYI